MPGMDRVAAVALFIRIVESGSFSKAATEFGITQPTATKAVAAMEERLGARLLHRTTRGVSPTEVGALYYDKCKAITHEIEAADNLATLMQSGVGGTLRVSTSVAFGRRVLVPLAMKYMREHPTLTVDLSFDDRYVNMVEQGIDVAVHDGITPGLQLRIGVAHLADQHVHQREEERLVQPELPSVAHRPAHDPAGDRPPAPGGLRRRRRLPAPLRPLGPAALSGAGRRPGG